MSTTQPVSPGLVKLMSALAGIELLLGFAASRTELPESTYSERWSFVMQHPVIALHVLVGSALFALAIVLFVQAIRASDKSVRDYTLAGLGFVLIAYAAGERFVATGSDAIAMVMLAGCIGTLTIYGILSKKLRPHRPKDEHNKSGN